MRLWSGLPGLAAVVERLRPGLRVFADERGRELLDLPDAPIATGDEPAPPRFLPWFDNLLLGHDDRSRVLPYGHRLGVVGGSAFVLVDGFARATWRIERDGERATLRVQPLEELGDLRRDRRGGRAAARVRRSRSQRRRAVVGSAPRRSDVTAFATLDELGKIGIWTSYRPFGSRTRRPRRPRSWRSSATAPWWRGRLAAGARRPADPGGHVDAASRATGHPQRLGATTRRRRRAQDGALRSGVPAGASCSASASATRRRRATTGAR